MTATRESLDSAQDQITEGWDSIADAKKQLADGWDQYNTSLENFEAQKAEALRNANADQLVNMQTLSQLIYAQNFAMPAGYLDDAEDNSWLLKVGSNYESVDELSNIVLTNIEDIGDVRLCDVADITVIDNADDSYARLNGQSAVVLSVFKSSTAGTNEVSKKYRCCNFRAGRAVSRTVGTDTDGSGRLHNYDHKWRIAEHDRRCGTGDPDPGAVLKGCKTHHRCSCQHSPCLF